LQQRIVVIDACGALKAQPVWLFAIDEQHADLRVPEQVTHGIKHAVAVVAGKRNSLAVEDANEPRIATRISDRVSALVTYGPQKEHLASFDERLVLWRNSLAEEPIVRLILDGTVVRVRLDRKATTISLLVVIGVRADGQKMLLAIKSMGGESTEAWRAVLDDLIKRGLRRPQFLSVDCAPGLDKALAVVWEGVPVQRCTVHKHRNLLAHAPERLHEEVTADYTDMIYAATPKEIETRRKAFIRKWRLRHRPVADCLEEAGDRLFSFTRLPASQWRSARTTNAIERLHEEFKRRIKTQTVLPSADTAAMLFWALLASGQINMRKVDGWHTLATKPIDQPIDLAA